MTTTAPSESETLETGKAGKALVWSFANTMAARLGTLGFGIVLARLLGPSEFGTYAVAYVALTAILSFNELGVSLAIVRWKDDPAAIAPTVTTISVLTSAVLTAAAVIAAPAFARGMGDASATLAVQLLSICVLISGLVATPAALMQRAFQQRERTIVDQVNTWSGVLVSVALALFGVGAMALVVGRLFGAAVSGVLFVYYSPLPLRFGLDRDHLRALLRFGTPLAGSSIIVFLVGFADQLVVGHVLGSVLLGFYVLATNLSNWPVTMFSQPLRAVAPALFARLHAVPARQRADFQRILRPLGGVAIPVCVVISAAAPEIVRFLYGEQWAPAAPVLRWLAILAALRIFFELAYDFLVVLGRSATILVIQATWIVVLVPVLVYATDKHGIAGASASLVAVSALVSVPMYLVAFRRSGIPGREIGRSLAMPAIAGLIATGGTLVLTAWIPVTFFALAACGVLMAATAAATLWLFRSDLDVVRRRR